MVLAAILHERFQNCGFSARLITALIAAGYDGPQRLLMATPGQLQLIDGVGAKGRAEIEAYRIRQDMRPLHDARLEHLGPRDRVHVGCDCGYSDLLTAANLRRAGVEEHDRIAALATRLWCRACGAKGKGLVLVKWAGQELSVTGTSSL